jgi:hypothetical protein
MYDGQRTTPAEAEPDPVNGVNRIEHRGRTRHADRAAEREPPLRRSVPSPEYGGFQLQEPKG